MFLSPEVFQTPFKDAFHSSLYLLNIFFSMLVIADSNFCDSAKYTHAATQYQYWYMIQQDR